MFKCRILRFLGELPTSLQPRACSSVLFPSYSLACHVSSVYTTILWPALSLGDSGCWDLEEDEEVETLTHCGPILHVTKRGAVRRKHGYHCIDQSCHLSVTLNGNSCSELGPQELPHPSF